SYLAMLANELSPKRMDPAVETFIGLVTDLHPEDFGIFFRQAVWALKILMASKAIREEKNGDVDGAALVEHIHAGLKDFLSLGEDFLRLIVAATPQPVLKRTIEKTGGVEWFASAISVDLSEGVDQLHSHFLTDEKLVSMLKSSQKLQSPRE